MKKRVLIVGSKGMAGHVIRQYLKAVGDHTVLDISRSDEHFTSDYKLDVSDLAQLKRALEDAKPDVVVNCIGVLNRAADEDHARAVLLNSYLPHFLSGYGKELGYRLIHISTDCVFSGKRGLYKKTDEPDGTDMYARSKALGEVINNRDLTIRTSIIGPELKKNGIGLFDWFMKQDGTVRGYTNAIWTGVTTTTLAIAIEQFIAQDTAGLYQLVNNIPISKYELLRLIKSRFSKNDIVIEPYGDYTVNKSLVDADNTITVPSYEKMIADMKDWIQTHKTIYPAYYQ